MKFKNTTAQKLAELAQRTDDDKINYQTRSHYIRSSNNAANPNKNVCTSAVCDYYGVLDAVPFLHTMGDVRAALDSQYSTFSLYKVSAVVELGLPRDTVANMYRKVTTVHSLKKLLPKLTAITSK